MVIMTGGIACGWVRTTEVMAMTALHKMVVILQLLTETCSLLKQGIHCPALCDHIADSGLEFIEVTCFL